MNIAERAVASAIPLEVKKDALRQTQSGEWKVTFTVQAADMDPRLTSAPMGTRYQLAMVEIGDNEEPKGRTDWRDLQPTAQAGIRCQEPRFRDFLAVEYGFVTNTDEEAAVVVRQICGVESRKDLSIKHKARTLWRQLDSRYLGWAFG